jgi:hypothetical protein
MPKTRNFGIQQVGSGQSWVQNLEAMKRVVHQFFVRPEEFLVRSGHVIRGINDTVANRAQIRELDNPGQVVWHSTKIDPKVGADGSL